MFEERACDLRFPFPRTRFPDPDWIGIETQPRCPAGGPSPRALQTRTADQGRTVSSNPIGHCLATGPISKALPWLLLFFLAAMLMMLTANLEEQ